MPPDEWMRRLGALPLLHQPGERWLYHTGYDVLAVLLARVAGRPLGELLEERLFSPLGMADTAFFVPAEKAERLTGCYEADASGALVRYTQADTFLEPAVFPAELVSTAGDYLTFARMLLNQGRHIGQRLLSRPGTALMMTDHLTPAQKAASPFFPGFWDTQGWGFGGSLVTRRDLLGDTLGRFGWDGGFGTSYFIDPAEDLAATVMAQRCYDEVFARLQADFSTLVYQAIDD